MVHGELIRTGQVQKLTYKQVRSLERIDAKKAREQKLLEILENVPLAIGYAVGQGFNALGETMQGLLSGDVLALGVKTAGALTFLAWLTVNYPDFARFTHLDHLGFGSGASPPPPGVNPPPGIGGQAPNSGKTGSGQWELHFRYVGPYGPIDQYAYYGTRDEAQTAGDYYANHTAGNFIVISIQQV